MRNQKKVLLLAALSLSILSARAAELTEAVKFDIGPQALETALLEFSKQAGVQVFGPAQGVVGKKTAGVQGEHVAEQALKELLKDSGLSYRLVNSRTVAIGMEEGERAQVRIGEGVRVAQVEAQEGVQDKGVEDQEGENAKDGDEESERGGIPEILVTGSKVGTLNADIRRTEDDMQPYVVFDRQSIERSSAVNLEEFFKNELTMSASALTAIQVEQGGNRSTINLRGLGADETLILIDGRRVAGVNYEGSPQQPNINGIPLAAIERIEVLPTTASGIFGGGATGGAINIVLRRDYAGFETQLTYGNTLESDAANRRVDLNAGFNLEGGRMNVLLSGSYSSANPLLVNERDFVQRGRQHIIGVNNGNVEALNEFGVIPPLGATTNIFSPSGNLVLDPEFGGTDLGSPITYVPVGYPGVGAAADGGAALAENAGRYNLNLAPTAQQSGGQYGLLSAGETKSLMLTLRREFTHRIEAFLELQGFDTSTQYSANFANLTALIPANAPNNPFQQAIIVKAPTVGMDEDVLSETQDRRAVAGLIAQLAPGWQLATDFTWSRSRFSYVWPRGLSSTSSAAVNSGTLDVLRDLIQYPVTWEADVASFHSPADTVLKNIAMRLAGPLPLPLPGGSPTLSFLLEHRDELLNDAVRTCIQCGSSLLFPARSQEVNSAYFETRLPLVSLRNRRSAFELLELQLTLRADDYRVTGATFVNLAAPVPIERFTNKNSSIDPTIGLRYQPVLDLTFRASYGTGYLPPAMTQLVPDPPFPSDISFAGLTDPLRGNEPISLVEWFPGGNPDLLPEESESESIGMIFTPGALQGLRVAADWSRVTKTNNIQTAFALDQASLETFINHFPERITRGESTGGFSVGQIIGIDNTLLNIAKLRVEALDLAIDYRIETDRAGTFTLSADATRLFSRATQAAIGAEVVENAGVMIDLTDGALKWKANGSINWMYRAWNFGWRMRFFDSYFFDIAHTVDQGQGAASVPSQIYHDLYGGYRFNPSSVSIFSALADTEIRFGINNVFDKEPPVDVVRAGVLMYSRLGDPRLANYYLTLHKSFGR